VLASHPGRCWACCCLWELLATAAPPFPGPFPALHLQCNCQGPMYPSIHTPDIHPSYPSFPFVSQLLLLSPSSHTHLHCNIPVLLSYYLLRTSLAHLLPPPFFNLSQLHTLDKEGKTTPSQPRLVRDSIHRPNPFSLLTSSRPSLSLPALGVWLLHSHPHKLLFFGSFLGFFVFGCPSLAHRVGWFELDWIGLIWLDRIGLFSCLDCSIHFIKLPTSPTVVNRLTNCNCNARISHTSTTLCSAAWLYHTARFTESSLVSQKSHLPLRPRPPPAVTESVAPSPITDLIWICWSSETLPSAVLCRESQRFNHSVVSDLSCPRALDLYQ
jgi:hypothetical protein